MANIRQVGAISADRAPAGSSTGLSRPEPTLSAKQRGTLSFIALFVPLFGIVVGVWLRARVLRAGAGQPSAVDFKFTKFLIILSVVVTIWAAILILLALNPVGSLPPDSPMIGAFV
jgi:hypothetical protein